jgi:hypothetical protein
MSTKPKRLVHDFVEDVAPVVAAARSREGITSDRPPPRTPDQTNSSSVMVVPKFATSAATTGVTGMIWASSVSVATGLTRW